MSQCAICIRQIKGLVWKSAHTKWDYCGKCMYDTHLDPNAKLDPFGNPREKKKAEVVSAQPHYFGQKTDV